MFAVASDEGITILIYIYWSLLCVDFFYFLNKNDGWKYFFFRKFINDRVLVCLLKMVLMSLEVVSFVNFNGFLELNFVVDSFFLNFIVSCVTTLLLWEIHGLMNAWVYLLEFCLKGISHTRHFFVEISKNSFVLFLFFEYKIANKSFTYHILSTDG